MPAKLRHLVVAVLLVGCVSPERRALRAHRRESLRLFTWAWSPPAADETPDEAALREAIRDLESP